MVKGRSSFLDSEVTWLASRSFQGNTDRDYAESAVISALACTEAQLFARRLGGCATSLQRGVTTWGQVPGSAGSRLFSKTQARTPALQGSPVGRNAVYSADQPQPPHRTGERRVGRFVGRGTGGCAIAYPPYAAGEAFPVAQASLPASLKRALPRRAECSLFRQPTALLLAGVEKKANGHRSPFDY